MNSEFETAVRFPTRLCPVPYSAGPTRKQSAVGSYQRSSPSLNIKYIFIEAELSRGLVRIVAGVGVDVDGKGHGGILTKPCWPDFALSFLSSW